MNQRKPYWGLLRQRPILALTLKGWCVFLILGGLLVLAAMKNIQPFLAVNKPVPSDILVVEGWIPDYGFRTAIAEFKSKSYKTLFVTGVPMEKGEALSEYGSQAELGAAILLKMGMDPGVVQAVPAPRVRQDRTYASALALKHWLKTNGISVSSLNVMSEGAHCRRTRLLFEKALGKEVSVGIITVEDQSYDPKSWWKFSEGVRSIVSELAAYGYSRLFFWPPATD